jgi:hypothetical protein
MSNDMASTDPMLASSGERTRKAGELRDEIYKKLAQAKGIGCSSGTEPSMDRSFRE